MPQILPGRPLTQAAGTAPRQATPAPTPPPDKQPDTLAGATQAAPVEATPPPQKNDEEARLALMAKQTRMQRELQREIAQLKAQLEERTKPQTAQSSQEDWKSALKRDFWGTVSQAGLTPDEIVQLQLQQPGPQDVAMRQMQGLVQSLKAELEELKSGQKQAVDQGREAARKQIAHDVRSLVGADPTLEAMKVNGDSAVEAVVSLIERTYDEDGYLMDTAEAVKLVEDHLLEEAMSLAKLNKVQERLKPAAPAPTEQAEGAEKLNQTQKPVQTLSSRMVPPAAKSLTPQQRRLRAIAIAEGREPPTF